MPPSGDPAGYKSTRVVVVPEEEEDFFSKLPDDVIISVLSRLNKIEHRATTSLLARRWRDLWKYSTCTTLSFYKGNSYSAAKFVDRVNRTLMSLGRHDCKCATNIDDFNLVFDMKNGDYVYQSDIDRWLAFALQNKVKRLYLSGVNEVFRRLSRDHTVALDSLTSLRLYMVQVTGELLEYILSVSPLLEKLSVSLCGPSLVSFTVSGMSLKLKHLEVHSYFPLKLYIHGVNLESLHYSGAAKNLIIKDTPCLVQARTSLHCFSYTNMNDDLAQMLSKLPHLEMLALNLSVPQFVQTVRRTDSLPKLRNLKRLELMIRARDSYGLCAALLDACPILHKLNIEVTKLPYLDDSSKGDKERALSHPHKSLKVLEVTGFTGCQFHMGLLDYLIESTASLEEMVVVPCYLNWSTDPGKLEAVRGLAKTHLEKRLTPGTKILVK